MINSFVGIGFGHIVSLDALDHLLFLAALAACYRPRDWRHGAAVATAFTVGHSVTLALASLRVVAFPTAIVEFLIPCTIVVAAAENMLQRTERPSGRLRPMLAATFGLVHGAGFANTLTELFDGGAVIPLLGFNIGIELGQLLVLTAFVALLTMLDTVLTTSTAPTGAATQWRTRLTSVTVAAVAVVLAAGRAPW